MIKRKERLEIVFYNLEGFQQLVSIHDAELVCGGRVLFQIHLSFHAADLILLEKFSVGVEQLGGETSFGHFVVADAKLHEMLGGVRIYDGVQGDGGVIVHPDGLDFVGLLHTLNDECVVARCPLYGDLAHGVCDGAPVSRGCAANGNYSGLGQQNVGQKAYAKYDENFFHYKDYFIFSELQNG